MPEKLSANDLGRAGRFCSFSDTDRLLYSYDASPDWELPRGVFRPENERDVAAIVKCALKHRFSICPRGAGTSTTGSSVPGKNCFSVSTEKMNSVIDFSETDMTVTVQSGVITGRLQKFCQKKGMYYPPDPASAAVCTVGGNISTNAGGIRGFKYGVTRDYILEVTAVSGDGKIMSFGSANRRYASGYPLHQLFCGAEGTLGIITSAVLRLIPAVNSFFTACIGFEKISDLLLFAHVFLRNQGITPSIMEFLDSNCLFAIDLYKKAGISEKCRYGLIIQLDGYESDSLKRHQKLIADYLVRNRLCNCCVSDSGDEILSWRKGLMAAFSHIGPSVVSGDVLVPPGRISDFISSVEQVKTSDITLVLFGHLGDGNFHPNIIFDQKNPMAVSEMKRIYHSLHLSAAESGGMISGEHGIGIEKKQLFRRVTPAGTVMMMRNLKKAIDPAAIFNPGKIF